ncbi:MAG: UDP-N-acetylglucosamine 1-carboxyvinyltransferase [Alphaproteobacteria bacterium]
MDKIKITGGIPLKGQIAISGAKNAALPLMAACLLTDKKLHLSNVPDLADIKTMKSLLAQHGVGIEEKDENSITLEAKNITSTTAPYDLVRQMRASVLVLGPLVAREKKAFVSLPGGCAIGTRPIDLHLDALEKLGASIELSEGYIKAEAPNGLTGAKIIFPKVTVGGTENILMAATLAKGTTVITNAAQEPEITDLADCLIAMGAKIEGAGTSTIRVEGVDSLVEARHSVISDRIETATFAIAAAITRGSIELIRGRTDIISSPAMLLTDLGVAIEETEKGFKVDAEDAVLIGCDVMTEPYPGFPTDLQAQMMALMATAHGASLITETIFENRFMHVPELVRMGANINIHGSSSAIIRGVNHLSGAQVMATDLRASVSLVLAGLAAKGETIINRVYHLDRGYEKIEKKLANCGAIIERIK